MLLISAQVPPQQGQSRISSYKLYSTHTFMPTTWKEAGILEEGCSCPLIFMPNLLQLPAACTMVAHCCLGPEQLQLLLPFGQETILNGKKKAIIIRYFITRDLEN